MLSLSLRSDYLEENSQKTSSIKNQPVQTPNDPKWRLPGEGRGESFRAVWGVLFFVMSQALHHLLPDPLSERSIPWATAAGQFIKTVRVRKWPKMVWNEFPPYLTVILGACEPLRHGPPITGRSAGLFFPGPINLAETPFGGWSKLGILGDFSTRLTATIWR